MKEKAIIKIKNLIFSYSPDSKPILSNINLTINEGETVLLTGPSGCGKTTLCRCLNGLIPHFYTSGYFKGEVIIAGMNTIETPIPKLAQYVGFVFQNPENQLFTLNVERELAFGPENLMLPPDEIKRRVDWALKVTGIEHLKNCSIYELSGGEQQRVAIAACLTMQPKILVLDEPTANLDPLGAKKILDLIFQLNRRLNLTVIIVEHRLDLLIHKVDRIIIMDKGKIIVDMHPRAAVKDYNLENFGVSPPKVVTLYKKLQALKLIEGNPPLHVRELAAKILSLLGEQLDPS